METLKEYGPAATRGQLLLFAWIVRNKPEQNQLLRRSDIPKALQPHVDQLMTLGILAKSYNKFKSFTGKQKICYVKLIKSCKYPRIAEQQPREKATPIPFKYQQLTPAQPVGRIVPKNGLNAFKYPDEETRLADRRARLASGLDY